MQTCRQNFTEKKVKAIKRTLPQVNYDPLGPLRTAFSKWKPDMEIPEFKLEPVTNREVSMMIMKLKNSSAFGHDGIDPLFIKFGIKFFVGPITHVINCSLKTGVFPARWKLARDHTTDQVKRC